MSWLPSKSAIVLAILRTLVKPLALMFNLLITASINTASSLCSLQYVGSLEGVIAALVRKDSLFLI